MRTAAGSRREAFTWLAASTATTPGPGVLSRVKKLIPMLDVSVVVSVLALFALLGLSVKAVERL